MGNSPMTNPVRFGGIGKEFFGIWIVNLLLSVITIGIYSAWAKVRTKRYFYGNTSIAGDNFEYHAQPIQILKGRLVVFAVVVVWSIIGNISPTFSMALLCVFYLALPWLLWSNARFDAVMTSYRNVHFSFSATLKDAYVTILGRGFLAFVATMAYFFIVGMAASLSKTSPMIPIILGVGSLFVLAVLYAWVIAGVQKLFANSYQYGNWQFKAELTNAFFIKTYLKAVLIGVVAAIILVFVLGLSIAREVDFYGLLSGDPSSLMNDSMFSLFIFGYVILLSLFIALSAYITTCIRNHVFEQLCLNNNLDTVIGYQFNSSFTVKGYVWLVVSNFFLQVVTLGIARPWIMVRTARYVADNTKVIGDLDLLTAIDQRSNVKSAVSDEMAQAFDLGIGIS